MTTTSWFVTATEARNNVIKDIAVHNEISALESAVLLAVQQGLYETTVTDSSLMTSSSTMTPITVTVNLDGTFAYVNHAFVNGDAVQLSSNGVLPPPFNSTAFYYVIYVDANTFRLAASRADALALRPISVSVSEGVTLVSVSSTGSGYLTTPGVSFSDVGASRSATALAILYTYGVINNITLNNAGGAITDVPTVQLTTVGQGLQLGAPRFKLLAAHVALGGHNYAVGDTISVSDGGDGTGQLVVTAETGGAITAVAVSMPGSFGNPALALTFGTSGSGVGATFTVSMGLSEIPVLVGGFNYINPPVIDISGGSYVSAARAIANVSGSTVTSITVTTTGYGYTSTPTITVLNGSGATAAARLIPTTVASATLTNNGGNTYTQTPSASVNTLGSGALVNVVSMKVVATQLVNAGSGYLQGDQLQVAGGTTSHPCVVEVLAVDSAGRITQLNLVDPGVYITLPTVAANVMLGGSGVGASLNLTFGVAAVSLIGGGNGYVTPPVVIFDAMSGQGAQAYTTLDGSGHVATVEVTAPGSGYVDVPTVTLTGGDGATVSVTLTATTLDTITVLNGGSGYNTAPTITIVGGGGSGAQAIANMSGDSIASVTVTNSGMGYTGTPLVSVEGNAQLQANLVPTSISSLTVSQEGSNYTHTPTLALSGAATGIVQLKGTGILAVDVLQQGSYYVSSPLVEFTAGAHQMGTPSWPIATAVRSFGVERVVVTDPGSGYPVAPEVQFSTPSMGSAATGVATIGAGASTVQVTGYPVSRDYFQVWKNQVPSNSLVTRPYADQMNAVTTYFGNLGYTILRYTNPQTLNTMAWRIEW